MQVNMAFVDALEREKKQKQEEQRPQIQIPVDDRTKPICDKIGCTEKVNSVGKRVCFWCGKPM